MNRRNFLAAAATLAPAFAKPAFNAEVGINIYSLRNEAAKDLPGTLALISKLGFRKVEAGDLYGRTPSDYLHLLRANGLQAVSMGASWDDLNKDAAAVGVRAGAIGASYVVCSTIPHSAKHLAEADVPPAAAALNAWGRVLSKQGLHLCYHTHGTEFDPSPDGTRFDTLLKLTDPEHVAYEMDIFWIVYGFQDPVAMLARYPGRFPLMHIKDIRKGTKLGGSPADVLEEESVPLGTGIVKVEPALIAGQQHGVRHFFLEEEAVPALPQIRKSLEYLKRLRG
ncbi:MAG: TIM barrel protein [Bryobacteraceae bacterium]|nr:TIM barrel protein [Bryobacteraceae bacterium]